MVQRYWSAVFNESFFASNLAKRPMTTLSTSPVDLKRLQLRTRRLVATALHGGYRTAFRGSGLVFSDIRPYEPGDDGKRIHWAATARSGTPLVKSYEEDRHLSMMLLMDTSPSVQLGEGMAGFTRARTFGELVINLASVHRDSVGLCQCGPEVLDYRKPASSRAHRHLLISNLAEPQQSVSTSSDLRPGLQAILKHQKRPGVVFVVSDFFVPEFEESLRQITHRHDTICVQLRHPFFLDVPSAGIVAFRDVESGEAVLIDTYSAASRRAIESALTNHHRRLAELCGRCRADLITVDTDPVGSFLSFLRSRTARIR